jgi:E3 ubiquitin-protein ligase HUWE1
LTFLEALPDDLRQEVVNEHLREQTQGRTDNISSTEISADFLEALPFEIREELLRQERLETERRAAENAPATLPEPPAPAADRAFTENNFLQQFEEAINSLPGRLQAATATATASTPAAAGTKKVSGRDSIQLLDKSGITSLLRLIFVPEPSSKAPLNRILTNLCENSKTRAELLNLLVSILEDGIHDLAAVDKGLSELSLKSDRSQRIKWAPHVGDDMKNMPNLVAQRCLESLTLLVTSGSTSSRYFLTESDREHGLKTPKSSKKGKERERHVTNHIPAVSLLNLLERPSFLQNSAILEQMMNLLSNVLRPLSLIAKKRHAQQLEIESAEKAENKDVTMTPASKDAKPEVCLTLKDKPEIKLPVIPVSAVQGVVNVLKDGICSLKTFQNTLNAIQYISSYPEHKATITDQLLESAQLVSDGIIPALSRLADQLHKIDPSVEMDGQILSKFAAPSADQAKLLRILKTIDFLNKAEEAGPQKKVESSALEAAHGALRALYDKLTISELWKKLSEAMTIVEQKGSLVHVATVLLPLIESFLVKSKPYVHIRKMQSAANLLRQNSEFVEDDQLLNPFLQFTKEHSKILNTYSFYNFRMVRNNPSLMNGSFSLLVQNPKVLEFDNKRTYFTQQLHKKNGRDYGSLQINVRRAYVFEDSYHQLQGKIGNEIKYSKLNVRFHEEEGVDAGGVTREWFSVLARQMFNPNYALFRPAAADKVTYQPNRTSGINPGTFI